jgi:hypothetical protein
MLNPNNFGRALAERYDFAKDREQARAAYSNTIKFSTNIALAHTQLAIVEIILGNYEAAEASLRAADGLPGDTDVNTLQRIYGYQRLDLQADVDRLVSEFDDFASTNTIPAASGILVSLATGDNETALRLLQEAGENKIPYDAPILLMRIKLNVFDDPVLEHPEVVAARAKLGFTDL